MRNSTCNLCSLGSQSPKPPKHVCLMPTLPESCDIMIVAENPTVKDDDFGRIFVGDGLKGIKDFFTEGDINLSVYCSFAVKCRRPNKDTKITGLNHKTCGINYLRKEIEQLKPKHIIFLGAGALYAGTGTKGITEKRGTRYFDDKINAYVYCTLHQAQALYDEQNKKTLWEDLNLFKGWITGTSEYDENKFNPPIHIADTLKRLRRVQQLIKEANCPIACDTETTGLNPYDPNGQIRTIQFCWDVDFGGITIPLETGEGSYFEDETGNKIPVDSFWTEEEWIEVGEILRDILFNNYIDWHNGKFDRLWLHEWGIRKFGYPLLAPNIHMDTLHVAHLFDENRLLGLKKLITQELGFPTYDIPDKLTKNLSVLFEYAAKDAVASLMLAQKFGKDLHNPDLFKVKRLYETIIKPMDRLFTKIELKGWPVCEKVAEQVQNDLQIKQDILTADILQWLFNKGIKEIPIDHVVKGKKVTKLESIDASTIGSTTKLAVIIFKCLRLPVCSDKKIAYTEGGALSTQENALVHIKDHEFIVKLLDWRGLNKAITTYTRPMLLAAQTRGRLTTSYKLTGTATGRTASGKELGKSKVKSHAMNLQNLPQDERDKFVDGKLVRKALVTGVRNIVRPAEDDPYDTIVECVKKGTRIATDRGMIPIEQVHIGDNVLQEDGTLQKVLKVIPQGIKKTYKIYSKMGYSLIATKSHKLRTINTLGEYDWKEVKNLVINDIVALASNLSTQVKDINLTISPLEFYHGSHNCSITIPGKIDWKLAEYFGYYAGDGCFNPKYLGQMVCRKDPDLLEYLNSTMVELFNAKPQLIVQRGAWFQKFGSKPLVERLMGLELCKTKVPSWVWESSLQVKTAYLRGLFEADGSVQSGKNGGRISLSAKSEGFLQEVQELLLSCGILSTRKPLKIQGSIYWHITIPSYFSDKFKEDINFISNRKKLELEKLCEYSGYSPSLGSLPNMQEKVRNINLTGEVRRLLANTTTLGRPISIPLAKTIDNEYSQVSNELGLYRMAKWGQYYDKIINIEESTEEEVYDLTIEGTATYQQASFISHNCDLSQIELRIAGELAQDKFMIRAYNENRDLHMLRGMRVKFPQLSDWDELEEKFKEIKKENPNLAKKIRQDAKACIAEGNLVLTNHGLIPIEKVQLTDKVWDGVSWVKHEGVIFKGLQNVITVQGLTATPDHIVYLTNGKQVELQEVTDGTNKFKIATGGIGELPVRYSTTSRRTFSRRWSYSNKSLLLSMPENLPHKYKQYKENENNKLSMSTSHQVHQQYRRSEPGSHRSFRGTVRRDSSEMRQSQRTKLRKLWWKRNREQIHERNLYSVYAGKPTSRELQRSTNRSDRQQQPLYAWEFKSSNSTSKSMQQENFSICGIQRGAYKYSLFTRKIKTRLSGFQNVCMDNGEISSKRNTVAGDINEKSTRYIQKVYDIVNAGPNHRFTVSNVIVSNCNFGFLYGMQATKFQRYALSDYDTHFTLAECQEIRNTFFRDHVSLPKWYQEVENFALEHEYVESLDGRRRHCPNIKLDSSAGNEARQKYAETVRQLINTPVQNFASSIKLMSMIEVDEKLDPGQGFLIGEIHDSIVIQCKSQYAKQIAEMGINVMRNPRLLKDMGIQLSIPLDAEAKIGPSLGEAK